MKAIVSLTAALAALVGSAAQADGFDWNSGWTVGGGLAYIHLQSTSSDLSGRYAPPGLDLKVRDATTVFLSINKRINEHFDLELAGGTPPRHDVVGKGTPTAGGSSVPYDGVVLSRARELAPTVLLNYNFLDEHAPVRPYVGLGINYTHFYDIQSTSGGDAVGGGPTSISEKDSWGVAGQVGLHWQIENRWSLNTSILKADVKSNLTADTAGVYRTAHIDFNPTVFVVAANYSF